MVNKKKGGRAKKVKAGTANLIPRKAPDAPKFNLENSATLTARLDLDDVQWLKGMPEGASYHIRQAIRLYRESLQESETLESDDDS